jgi:septal ring factor EnvC (AmiA/AmiB activator)
MSETTINEAQEFKSPVRKLLRFFHKSRDGWRRKHHELRGRCKKLSNQVRAVERSRQQWKTRVKEQEQRLGELERELEALKGVA